MMAMNEQMKSMRTCRRTGWSTSRRPTSTRLPSKAEANGAKLIVPPMDIPNVGRFSVISDPQGAVFALYKPLRG